MSMGSPAIDEAAHRAEAVRCLSELHTTISPEKRREVLDRMVKLQDRLAELEREERRRLSDARPRE
jgi:hypothetical protein